MEYADEGWEGPEGSHERRWQESTDIGHGVRIQFTGLHGAPDDLKAGIIVKHKHEDGTICEGSVLFDIPENHKFANRPKWQLESLDPLTLSPSILQRECGLHGFIREGRWVPA